MNGAAHETVNFAIIGPVAVVVGLVCGAGAVDQPIDGGCALTPGMQPERTRAGGPVRVRTPHP